MKTTRPHHALTALSCALLAGHAAAQSIDTIPQAMTTPDVVETGLGKLTFKNGAPTPETAKKVKEFLTFTNGLRL